MEHSQVPSFPSPFPSPILAIIIICTQKVRLIDYELMANEQKQRLVLFGKHAGYAGMIDGVHGLGQRLLGLGYSSPFLVRRHPTLCLVFVSQTHALLRYFYSHLSFVLFCTIGTN